MEKTKIPYFIGRQLSRLKAGQSYYMIIMTTITALSLMDMAFPDINTIFLIVLFPCILFGAFLIGYFMDKANVVTMDQQKTIEMTHRYLNTSDFKFNDFRMLQMEVFGEWMNSIQQDKPLDLDVLKEKYSKFLKKWKSPELNKKDE